MALTAARTTGLLLAAIAVQFVITGVCDSVADARAGREFLRVGAYVRTCSHIRVCVYGQASVSGGRVGGRAH